MEDGVEGKPMLDRGIEFKFEPAIYKTGNTISIIGSILVFLSVAGAIYLSTKKKEISI